MQVSSLNGKWTSLRLLLFPFLLLASTLDADVVLYKTLACPTVDTLQKVPLELKSNPLELEMFTIANSCIILNRGDSIEVLGYDPHSSKEKYQQILYKKTNTQYYLLRESIVVEQGGKKNSYRF